MIYFGLICAVHRRYLCCSLLSELRGAFTCNNGRVGISDGSWADRNAVRFSASSATLVRIVGIYQERDSTYLELVGNAEIDTEEGDEEKLEIVLELRGNFSQLS